MASAQKPYHGRAVVHERFARDLHRELGGGAELLEHGDHGDRVRGREDGPEDHTQIPGPPPGKERIGR